VDLESVWTLWRKQNISLLQGIELQFLDHQAHGQSLYGLHYPSS
jgi:hypothetical protein